MQPVSWAQVAIAQLMAADPPNAWVYILRCSDGSLYTGYTTDLDARLARHKAGQASKYTRSRLPVKLVFSEACETRSEAMTREKRIKAMPRRRKLALIRADPAEVAPHPT